MKQWQRVKLLVSEMLCFMSLYSQKIVSSRFKKKKKHAKKNLKDRQNAIQGDNIHLIGPLADLLKPANGRLVR